MVEVNPYHTPMAEADSMISPATTADEAGADDNGGLPIFAWVIIAILLVVGIAVIIEVIVMAMLKRKRKK